MTFVGQDMKVTTGEITSERVSVRSAVSPRGGSPIVLSATAECFQHSEGMRGFEHIAEGPPITGSEILHDATLFRNPINLCNDL